MLEMEDGSSTIPKREETNTIMLWLATDLSIL